MLPAQETGKERDPIEPPQGEPTKGPDPQRQDPQPPARVEPPVPVDAEADDRGAPIRVLTLDDALRMGRTQNVDLSAAELLPEQARLDMLFAEAGFEPELYVNGNYGEADSPRRSDFQPSNSQVTLDGAIGWRQRMITGGLFDLSYRPARFVTSGSNAFPDKLFTSEWSASYRQPLLRGAWTDYNLASVNLASFVHNQARHDFDSTVQDTLQGIVEAYWELVYSRENWRVVMSALDVAKEQLRITAERIRVRDLAPRDRVADEAEVARRQEELITAENEIRTREDDLRRLLFDAASPDFWRVNLRPISDMTVEPSTEKRAYEPLVGVALANRPDLSSLRSQVAQAEVALEQASSDALPSLDLIGAWSSDGARDQFHQAWRDATEAQYPDWSVGLEFSLPLGNNAARAARTRAELEVERRRRQLHAATLEATREVRQAARNLNSLAESIRASGESVRLAATNLDTEKVKLLVGASTAFEVQRRNQDLSEARTRHLRNQLDYRVAESRLLFVQGILAAPR
ncbi:MAG: TolC family protein [Planctomycetes bacterium]|nr:TolC family protein [Planctomycetota bacterium]